MDRENYFDYIIIFTILHVLETKETMDGDSPNI